MKHAARLALATSLACAAPPQPGDAAGAAPVHAPADTPPLPVDAPAPADTPPIPVEPPLIEPPAPATNPAPHACASDGDCVASCSQGAVQRRWYQRMFPGGEGCEDGCTRKGTDPPRCEAGTCVAYHDGAPDPLCTGKRDVVVEPQRPGPAHACTRDDQCRLSCTYGAVTTFWYDLVDRRRDECRDGCSSKGMSVRCEDGRCLALRHGEPYLECTERSIWADE